MFGVTIIRDRRLNKMLTTAAVNAQVGDAEKIRHILLTDENTRRVIARVARSTAKDHFEQLKEDARAAFEGTPEFQQWAQEQREQALAVSMDAEYVPPHTGVPVAPMMLRYGILGMLIEHGMQRMDVIVKSFPEAAPDMVRDGLGKLLAEGLVELTHGYYSAVDWAARLAALGSAEEATGKGRHANPDPQ